MNDSDQSEAGVSEAESRPNSKVARVTQQYDLGDFGDELVARWTGEAGGQQSLRELAEYTNQGLLQATMRQANMFVLDGEVENLYRLLQDDDVSAGKRLEAEATLERDGVDVEKLKRDFVSHQAIHSYLTKYRGVERSDGTDGQDQVEKAVDTIQQLKNRLVAVVEKNLQTLNNTDRITIGNVNVWVTVHVFCEDCATQYSIVDLLRQDGCDCKSDRS